MSASTIWQPLIIGTWLLKGRILQLDLEIRNSNIIFQRSDPQKNRLKNDHESTNLNKRVKKAYGPNSLRLLAMKSHLQSQTQNFGWIRLCNMQARRNWRSHGLAWLNCLIRSWQPKSRPGRKNRECSCRQIGRNSSHQRTDQTHQSSAHRAIG